MKNYILAQSFNRANMQDSLWYCMDEADKDILTTEEVIVFGDKVWIIKTHTLYIMGNDGIWYEM